MQSPSFFSPPAKRIKLESYSPKIQEDYHESNIEHDHMKEEAESASLGPADDAEMTQNTLDDESEENNCSICLQPIEDRTVVPTCSHEFCFECLLVWTEQSRRCPLCSQNIGEYVIHNIRSRYDYRKHYLNPLRKSPVPAQSRWNPSAAQDRARRAARQRRREREWGRTERVEREEADRLELSIEKRRWIYEHHLYAKHVASNAYTKYHPYPTPPQFAASPELISRTTSFLRRELQIWEGLDVEFLTTLIISLMKSIDIRSESAVKLLAEFLDMGQPEGRQPNAEHFAHEIYCYVRSPYRDLFVYDTVVQYDAPGSQNIPPPPTTRQRARRWRERTPSSSRSRSRSRSPRTREPRHCSGSPRTRKPGSPSHSPRPGHEIGQRSQGDSRRRIPCSRSRSRSYSMSWSPSGRTYPSAGERAASPRAFGSSSGRAAQRRVARSRIHRSRSRKRDRSRSRHKRAHTPDHTSLGKRGFAQDHEAPNRDEVSLGRSRNSEWDADEDQVEEGCDGHDVGILAVVRRDETSARHRRDDDRTPRASPLNSEPAITASFEGDLQIKGKGKRRAVDDDVNVAKHPTGSVSETEAEPRQSQDAHIVLFEKLDGGYGQPGGPSNTGVGAASAHAGSSSTSNTRPPRNRNLRDSVQAHLGRSGFSARTQGEPRGSYPSSKLTSTDVLPDSRRQGQRTSVSEPAGPTSSGPSLLARLSDPAVSSSTTSLRVGASVGTGNRTQAQGSIHNTTSSTQVVTSILPESSCHREALSASDNHSTLQTGLIVPKSLHRRGSRDGDRDAAQYRSMPDSASLFALQPKEGAPQRPRSLLTSSSSPSFGHQESSEGRLISTLSRSNSNDNNRSLVQNDSSQARTVIDSATAYAPDSERRASTFVTRGCAAAAVGVPQIMSSAGTSAPSSPAKRDAQATQATPVPAGAVAAHRTDQLSRASVRSDSTQDISSSVPGAGLHHVGSSPRQSITSYPIRDLSPSKSVSINDQSHKKGIGTDTYSMVDLRTRLMARLEEEREKAEVSAGNSGAPENINPIVTPTQGAKFMTSSSNSDMVGLVDGESSPRFDTIRGSGSLGDVSGRILDPSSDIVAADPRVMEAKLRARAQLRVRLAAEKRAGGFV